MFKLSPNHKLFITCSLLISLGSCVPQRQYNELKKSNEDVVKRQSDCNKKNVELEDSLRKANKTIKYQNESIRDLSQDTSTLGGANKRLNVLNNQINNAYERLLQKVKELEGQGAVKAQELAAEIQDASKRLKEQENQLKIQADDLRKREDALSISKRELDKSKDEIEDYKRSLGASQSEVAAKQKNVMELQAKLNQKDSLVNNLKNTVSKALLSYKDKGLSVAVKNGKVYVSVEDKLLFESGKYAINSLGKDAIKQIASVLSYEKEVNVLVEGHTDNVPYKAAANSVIKDNWDLSVLRATEVTKQLISNGIKGERLSAAGRGETLPLQSNASPDGRAKNRRTEIILTPKLDELFKILE